MIALDMIVGRNIRRVSVKHGSLELRYRVVASWPWSELYLGYNLLASLQPDLDLT